MTNIHDIDKERHGFAGAHDIISGKNINRELKKNENLREFQTILLSPPENYTGKKYKVLLIQGPHDDREGTILFPLGLGYIARMLVMMGCEVEVLDAHAKNYTKEDTVTDIRNRVFDLVGITALSTQYSFVKWISSEIKEYFPDKKVIVGGQLAHYNSETVLENSAVDICVRGEGEITIQDIIYNFDDLSGVKGITYKDYGNVIHRNSDRDRIANPDLIPYPYYDAFAMDYYFQQSIFGAAVRRSLNILSSRGCPYSCTFCSLSFPNVTYRSVDNVIAEIQYLKDYYNIDCVIFSDELFVISKNRVYEFCEKVKPLKIKWGGQARANIVDDDVKLIKAMKSSGCQYIGYGLESATNEMLSAMQKKSTVRQNMNAVKVALEQKMIVVAQYMFGFPGETIETIESGINFFKEVGYCPPLGLYSVPNISLTVPLPGSQLYEDSKENGLIKDEDEYLDKISVGYYFNKDIVVNLTDFSDEDLLELKKAAENTMWENYIAYLKDHDTLFWVKQWLSSIYKIWQAKGTLLFLKGAIVKALRILIKKDEHIPNLGVPKYENIKTDYVFRPSTSVSGLESTVNE
ncbi:B12-binding domain-containing radical SAM protein [Acidobacteria bacterium AH-259-D05]|nr:B12-binding domain-containing radical SAM protein [Acidobacteria bacterium AH-259-D05]